MGKQLREIKLELEVIKKMIAMLFDERDVWQLMSTAPKDGTDILLAFEPTCGYMVMAKWWEKKKGYGWCCSFTNRRIHEPPTYWHALPDQPYTQEEQDEALRARAEASWPHLTNKQLVDTFNRLVGED